MTEITKSIDAEIAAFNPANPDIYSPQDIIEFALHIIKKAPATRTEKEIEILRIYTRKNSTFLTDATKRMGGSGFEQISYYLEHKFLLAGQPLPLSTAGSQNPSVFILIKGSVQLSYENLNNSPTAKNSGNDNQKKVESNSGAAFGGSAVLDDGSRAQQPTSVVCLENSHFATICKRDYNKVLLFTYKEELETHTKFLSSFEIFKHYPIHSLIPWVHLFSSKEVFSRKHVFYKQGETPSHIYLIKSGSVLCSKVIPFETEIMGPHKVGLDDKNQVFLMEKESFTKTVEITVLGKGQIFGDEEGVEAYIITKEMEREEKETAGNKVKLVKKGSQANKFITNTNEETLNLEISKIKRGTTMTVTSPNAEIWSIPISKFFGAFEKNRNEFHVIIDWISNKRERTAKRIASLQKNCQENISFLQSHKPAMLKKDIVSAIKQRKFQRLITEEPPQQQQQYNSTRHNSQPSNVESEYVASRSIIADPRFLTEIEYSVDNPGPTTIPKPSVRASLKDKDKGLTQNFYDAVNTQETRNSVVTEAWSPNKKSPRRVIGKGDLTLDISPLIGATSEPNSPISLPLNDDNKSVGRIKELEDPKKDEIVDETRAKISTMETDGEERMVTEIRSTNPVVTNNSRTSYIKDTIDKKFHVNMKLKKLKSGPGTGPHAFTRVLGELSIMKKAIKNDQAKKKASPKNSLREQQKLQDQMASVSSMVRKLTETKPADLQPIMKISSKLQKKVNDIFLPRGSFLSKIPMDSSFVKHKQSSSNHHWSEGEHEELDGKNKLNESTKLLELTEVPKSVLRAQHLQYDLNSAGIKGFKTIDDLPKDTLQAAENSKYYLSRVFPGFRPKSIIRRPPDYNAIFVEKLQKEASMRIRKAVRERREASMGNHSYLQTEPCGDDLHNNSTGAADSTLGKGYRRGRNTDSKSTKHWSYSVSRPVMTEM